MPGSTRKSDCHANHWCAHGSVGPYEKVRHCHVQSTSSLTLFYGSSTLYLAQWAAHATLLILLGNRSNQVSEQLQLCNHELYYVPQAYILRKPHIHEVLSTLASTP